MSESDNSREDFVLDPAMLLGVWASGTSVARHRDDFTVDFLRDVPELSPLVLVARALIPPAAAFDLRDQLDDALQSYTQIVDAGGAR